MVREGLRLLLETAKDIEIVGEVQNGLRAVRETKRLLPDVVLLDLSMPLLNGVEAARQIARDVPSAKVLILSAYTDVMHLQSVVEVGAAGYLTKGTCAQELVQAVREIARGHTFFSSSVPEGLLKQWQEKSAHDRRVRTKTTLLTSRQMELLQLIAEGFANKQIADLLGISLKTVEKHRQSLMNQLHIHNVALLTRYAVSMGLAESNCAPELPSDTTAPQPRCSERMLCSMSG